VGRGVRGRIFEDEFGYKDAGIRPDGELQKLEWDDAKLRSKAI
jgi:hypothetical protein